jgi:hypothetical protein
MTETTQSPEPEGRPLISSERVQGTPVYGTDGEKLGEIRDLMLHKLSGRVAYAVMAHGGFAGAGETSHPLPWSILTYDPERGGYAAPLSRSDLDGAPAMGADEIGESDASWRDRVHTHFQAAPYWM